MKIITKTLAALAALALIAGAFASCSSDAENWVVDPDTIPNKKVDYGTSIETEVSWDFNNSICVPEKLKGTLDSGKTKEVAVSDLSLSALSGTEATLKVTGSYKGIYADGDATGNGLMGYIQCAASSNVTIDNYPDAKHNLTLTLNGAAEVEIECAGAGSADEKRYVVLADSAGKKLAGEGNIGSDSVKVTSKVKAGTYTIAMNGSRITKITCKVIE